MHSKKETMRRFVLLWLTLCALTVWSAERVEKRVLLYPSIDQSGAPITLSGMISWPQNKHPKGIILLPHFTISADKEAPSNKGTGEEKHFQNDFVLIMPDYIGFGVTRERMHPYLHGELTAINCVDMYLHSLPVLDSLQLGLPLDSIYIVGFSQGGATALWILKHIEEQYPDRIHVKKCFAGSGPHDVAATFDDAVERNRIGMPMTIPMLVLGTGEAYDLNLQPEHFLTPAMMRTYTRFIKDKELTVSQVFFRTLNHRLSHWMTPAGMDRTDPETQRLYKAFQQSSIIHTTWTPHSPVYVFHSTNDDIVTFRCAEHLKQHLSDNPLITWDFGRYGNHLSSNLHFFSIVKAQLQFNFRQKR